MTNLGAGLLRLWAERQIADGRMINASQLAREATAAAAGGSSPGPVQPGTPWSIVLGRDNYSPQELARVLLFFGTDVEEAERIGEGDFDRLREVAGEWP